MRNKQNKTVMRIGRIDTFSMQALDRAPEERIGCPNWPEYPYTPDVRFAMLHDGEHLFLKFIVNEMSTAISTLADNTPVCGDSCVELFIAPDERGYYNFEFNAAGTLLTGYRLPGQSAERAPMELLNQVIRIPSLPRQILSEQSVGPWELTLILPKTIFFRHRIETLAGMHMKGNLYKCGDRLTIPHYLSWQPIRTERPTFHRPEFFSDLFFAE